MKSKFYIKLLVKHLNKYNALKAFAKNYALYGSLTFEEFIKLNAQNQSRDIFSSSFIWSDTKEGYDFWCNIDDEWTKIIETKIW